MRRQRAHSAATTTRSLANCHPSYPTVCIPPPPPDLDCGQISFRNFQVIYTVPGPDPHNFDGDRDGVGCES
jgi:micrococcal nuclease